MAVSKLHGIFVAARTSTPALSVPTPVVRRESYTSQFSSGVSIGWFTLHLNEKFRFYTTRRFGFIVISLTAQSIDFIDEDNARLSFTSHFEQAFHSFLTFTEPFREKIRRTDSDKRAFAFCGNSFGQIRFTRTGGLEKTTRSYLTDQSRRDLHRREEFRPMVSDFLWRNDKVHDQQLIQVHTFEKLWKLHG